MSPFRPVSWGDGTQDQTFPSLFREFLMIPSVAGVKLFAQQGFTSGILLVRAKEVNKPRSCPPHKPFGAASSSSLVKRPGPRTLADGAAALLGLTSEHHICLPPPVASGRFEEWRKTECVSAFCLGDQAQVGWANSRNDASGCWVRTWCYAGKRGCRHRLQTQSKIKE